MALPPVGARDVAAQLVYEQKLLAWRDNRQEFLRLCLTAVYALVPAYGAVSYAAFGYILEPGKVNKYAAIAFFICGVLGALVSIYAWSRLIAGIIVAGRKFQNMLGDRTSDAPLVYNKINSSDNDLFWAVWGAGGFMALLALWGIGALAVR